MTAEAKGKPAAPSGAGLRRGLAAVGVVLLAVLGADAWLLRREQASRSRLEDAQAGVREIQGIVSQEEFLAGLRHLHWLRELLRNEEGEGAGDDRIADENGIWRLVEELRARHRVTFRDGIVTPARVAGATWTDYAVEFTVEGVSLPALTDFLLEVERAQRVRVSELDLVRKDAEGRIWEARTKVTMRVEAGTGGTPRSG